MSKRTRDWLIAAVILVLGLSFTIFAGLSITNMTLTADPAKKPTKAEVPDTSVPEETSSTEEPDSTEDPSAEPTVDIYQTTPSEETDAPETDENGDPSGSNKPDGTGISYLPEDVIEEIRSNYSGEAIYYAPGSDKDEMNRPLEALNTKKIMDEAFGEGTVKIIDQPTSEIHLCFVVTEMDAGENTMAVLDVLDRYNLRATFFVAQDFSVSNPYIMSRILGDGHELGSCGRSYPEAGIGVYGLPEQLEDLYVLHEVIRDNYNYTMTKFYYGHGAYSMQSVAMVTKMGYTPCFYSAAYNDAGVNTAIDQNAFQSSLIAQLHYGAVYLLHAENAATAAVLPGFIEQANANGYSITKLK